MVCAVRSLSSITRKHSNSDIYRDVLHGCILSIFCNISRYSLSLVGSFDIGWRIVVSVVALNYLTM